MGHRFRDFFFDNKRVYRRRYTKLAEKVRSENGLRIQNEFNSKKTKKG